MQIKPLLYASIIAVLTSVTCIAYIDYPLARWIEINLRKGILEEYSNGLSSNLLKVVIVVSSLSFVAYLYLRTIQYLGKHRSFFLLLAITLPLSYLVKTGLKYSFSRIETRFWLSHPSTTQPHWFNFDGTQFNGFPSGHMLVLTIMFLAFWRFYPQFKAVYLLGWISLGVALLVTNYHFLSDVIMGGMIAFWVYLIMERIILRHAAPK
jgi:membrane-associated phospholipid phosphatase